MLAIKKHYYPFLIVGLMLFVIANNLMFFPNQVFAYDVFGYYLYLPFKFIYHNLGLTDQTVLNSIIAKYHNTESLYQISKLPEGQYVMKYTMGLSFFYAPFFFIGHFIAIVFGFQADGFSFPYQYSVFCGNILYSLAGIWIVSKVLRRFFSRKVSAWILLLIVFSTNYIVHIATFGQNAMSHSYLFTDYALILWWTIRWHETSKIKFAILLGFICGMSILSRPTEIVCVLLPMFWNIYNLQSFKEKLKWMRQHWTQILIFSLIILFLGSFQIAYWKIYTGKFLFTDYGGNVGEGFEFAHPYLLDVLFSFRKGWLVYTPVMAFAIMGFYIIFKQNKAVFWALFIYFILSLYIVSSWSCWWYAQSYSQRALIPSYPVLAIGLGFFIKNIIDKSYWIKGSVFVIMAFFVLLNLFQTWQFNTGILDGDRMTQAYYWKIFGKRNVSDEDRKLLLVNRAFDGKESPENESDYQARLLKYLNFESSPFPDSIHVHSGKFSMKLDQENPFSEGVIMPYYQLTQCDHAWLKISASVFTPSIIKKDLFRLNAHFDHQGKAYKYCSFDASEMHLKPNQWNVVMLYYLTPEVRSDRDTLRIYFWNRDEAKYFVDDMKVEILEKR